MIISSEKINEDFNGRATQKVHYAKMPSPIQMKIIIKLGTKREKSIYVLRRKKRWKNFGGRCNDTERIWSTLFRCSFFLVQYFLSSFIY